MPAKMSEFPAEGARVDGEVAPTTNGDGMASMVENYQNKKMLMNRMNSQSAAFSSNSSEKQVMSSSSSTSSSRVSKRSQMMHHSLSTSEMKQQQNCESSVLAASAIASSAIASSATAANTTSTAVSAESRNFSRSMSLSSSSATASSSSASMMSAANQTSSNTAHPNPLKMRGFSVDRLPIVTGEDLDEDDGPRPLVTLPDDLDEPRAVLPSSTERAPFPHSHALPPSGPGMVGCGDNSIKFEQKRLTQASKMKMMTDGFSAEKMAASNQELKRMQSGENCFEEKLSASAMKERLETGSFSSEKVAAVKQEQRQMTSSGVVQQEQRMASSAAMKVSTEAYTAEKVAMAKQEERQTISSQGMTHQETHMAKSSSSKLTITAKGICTKSSMLSSSQLESMASLMNGMGPGALALECDLGPGMLDDLERLTADSSPSDVEKAILRYTWLLTACVEKLRSVVEEETIPYLSSMNSVMRRAWAVPHHGHELGSSLCNALRSSGGVDVLIRNFGSCNEEVQFASARVLEQCLTTENRAHVVENGLDTVVHVARVCSTKNDVFHSRVGTGIMEHLFKHSEGTCSDVMRLGGLDAILYECRCSDIETLRHCAAALANLSLYGGSENQQQMIKRKVPMWLFPLAFNYDDNIKYYACLAIAALVANKEIEAAVIKSGTLDLVEPFVTSHSPADFATSTVAHAHGQSKNWLQRLVPVLNSKREEARSLAAFHFAMEAGIKKKQGNTEMFREIGAIEALKKVASSPNAIASKYAAQALRLIGEEVPHKLSQQVPLWTVEDVIEWVKQIGFSNLTQEFVSSRVDGDLLLQLTEENLRADLGIANGILRKRFVRELGILKKMADYSSCDPTYLNSFLQTIGAEFPLYTYRMLNSGLDKDMLRYLTEEQLAHECIIENSIHRLRILEASRSMSSSTSSIEEPCTVANKNLDVFVSYRRSNGSQLASLLKVHLQLRGFTVFIDVERLEAGKFDNNLLQSIRQAKHFLLVLTPNALDRCIADSECKDWVHREIVAALQSQCNIIPIIDNFQWPEAEQLPEDMRAVNYFNGVRWIHDYQDACVDKLERFMRGEMNVRSDGPLGRYANIGVPGTPGTPGAGSLVGRSAPSYQRSQSNESKGSFTSDKDSKEVNNTNGNAVTTSNSVSPIPVVVNGQLPPLPPQHQLPPITP